MTAYEAAKKEYDEVLYPAYRKASKRRAKRGDDDTYLERSRVRINEWRERAVKEDVRRGADASPDGCTPPRARAPRQKK